VFFHPPRDFEARSADISDTMSSSVSPVGRLGAVGVSARVNATPLSKFFENKEHSLLFVGDIMLSRNVGAEMELRNDYAYPFRKIADVLRSADLTFGNLEGPISDVGKDKHNLYSFRADPRSVEGLKISGFDVVSLANNHTMDWGEEAMEQTIELLRKEHILSVGAGKNAEEAGRPQIFDAGDSFRAGFLAYTTVAPPGAGALSNRGGVSETSLENMKKAVRELRDEVDVLVVSFHWGEEYEKRSGSEQQRIAYGLVDAGADIIVGHHPHVSQEIEKYKNGWIVYSLGNFVFDQYFSRQTMEGLMVKAIVREGRIIDIQSIFTPLTETYQPYVEN